MVVSVDEAGDVGRRWQLLYQLAAAAHLDDDLESSERLSEDALSLVAAVSATRALAAYGGQLLAIRLAQGRVAELADTFESMVADQPEVQRCSGVIWSSWASGPLPDAAALRLSL